MRLRDVIACCDSLRLGCLVSQSFILRKWQEQFKKRSDVWVLFQVLANAVFFVSFFEMWNCVCQSSYEVWLVNTLLCVLNIISVCDNEKLGPMLFFGWLAFLFTVVMVPEAWWLALTLSAWSKDVFNRGDGRVTGLVGLLILSVEVLFLHRRCYLIVLPIAVLILHVCSHLNFKYF